MAQTVSGAQAKAATAVKTALEKCIPQIQEGIKAYDGADLYRNMLWESLDTLDRDKVFPDGREGPYDTSAGAFDMTAYNEMYSLFFPDYDGTRNANATLHDRHYGPGSRGFLTDADLADMNARGPGAYKKIAAFLARAQQATWTQSHSAGKGLVYLPSQSTAGNMAVLLAYLGKQWSSSTGTIHGPWDANAEKKLKGMAGYEFSGTVVGRGAQYNQTLNLQEYDGSFDVKTSTPGIYKTLSAGQKAYVDFLHQNKGFHAQHIAPMMAAYDSMNSCNNEIGKAIGTWDNQKKHERYLAELGLPTDGTASSLDILARQMKELFTGVTKFDPAAWNDVNSNLADAVVASRQINILFQEQCFLLAKIIQLSSFKAGIVDSGDAPTSPTTKGLPSQTTNSSIQVTGDPYGFINKLTQDPSMAYFFDLETKKLASLQPHIRLYKVTEDKKNGTEKEREVAFESYVSYNSVESSFKMKAKRGFGAGIKKFTFKYEGSNPFSVKKSISAKLVIFANTFDELLIDRGGYRYIDLALKTGGDPDSTRSKGLQRLLDSTKYKLDFRLKAVVGWAQPQSLGDQTIQSRADKTALIDAVDANYVTLNLTPTIHEFDIDELGRVTFTINYLAYIEDFFDQPNFNIFSEPNLNARIFERTVMRKKIAATCDKDQAANYKKTRAKEIEEDKQKSLAGILGDLMNNKRIFYIEIPRQELILFASEGPFYERRNKVNINAESGGVKTINKDLARIIKGTFSGKKEKALLASAVVNDPANEQIGFFYVSDLVDAILGRIDSALRETPKVLDELKNTNGFLNNADLKAEKQRIKRFKEQFNKFRAVLGPMEIVNPKNNMESMFISLGDVPVSVKYFISWLSTKTKAKAETNYPLTSFLNDFFNTVMNDFMNTDTCFDNKPQQKLRTFQTALTSYREGVGGLDEMTMTMVNKGQRRLFLSDIGSNKRLLNIAGPRKSVKGEFGTETNWMIYHAGRTQPADRMNGNKKEDSQKGIFHYLLGKDRGIVKDISLKRTNTAGHKEVRFEQSGYDGLQQLREVYDVEISSFANVNAFPGTYIFVDPRGFAPNLDYNLKNDGFNLTDLTDYGLGGYFMIIGSEHTFGPGEANSVINAKWVAQIDKAVADGGDENMTNTGRGDGTPAACGKLASGRKEKSEKKGFFSALGSAIAGYFTKDSVTQAPPTP